MSQYSPMQLVFFDESAYDKRTLSHRYDWNFKGRRACKPTFFVHRKRFTIEGALYLNSLLAYAIQEGSMNSNDYFNFIEHILINILYFHKYFFNNYIIIKYLLNCPFWQTNLSAKIIRKN